MPHTKALSSSSTVTVAARYPTIYDVIPIKLIEGGTVQKISEDGISLNPLTIVEQNMPEMLRKRRCLNSERKKTPKVVNLNPRGDSSNVVVDIFLGKLTQLRGYFSIWSIS